MCMFGGQRNKDQVKGKWEREEKKEKMEEKRWNSRGLQIFDSFTLVIEPKISFLCLRMKWVVHPYVKWTM